MTPEFRRRLVTGDAALFALLFFVVLVTWDLVLGSPLTVLFGKSDTAGLVAHYIEMVRAGPSASAFLYSNTRFAGTVTGPADFPVYLQLFALIGIHPILAVDLSMVLSQSLVAFFTVTIPLLLTGRSWSREPLAVPLALTAAFLPALAWRLVYGHLNMVWGLLWAMALTYLLIAGARRRFTLTGGVLSVLALTNALQCINLLQPIVYGALILIAVAAAGVRTLRAAPRKREALIVVSVVVAGCVVFSLNHVANILVFVRALARSTGDAIIYSYNVQTARDFLSSLFYSYSTMPLERNFFLLHETNLGYGVLPLIIAGFAVIAKRHRLLLLNGSLFLFGIVLSANVPGLSDGVLALLPILKSFRCPSRIFFLLTYLQLLCLSYLAFTSGLHVGRTGTYLLYLAAAVTIGVPLGIALPPDVFLIPLASLLLMALARKSLAPTLVPAALGVFLALNVLGFRERIPADRPDLDALEREQKFFVIFPGLAQNLLEHSTSQVYSPVFGMNQAAAYGFSSVDGYAYPQRRFIELIRALVPETPLTQNQFSINSRSPFFPLFVNLFNVTGEITAGDAGYSFKRLRESTPVHRPASVRVAESPLPVIREFLGPPSSHSVAFVGPEFAPRFEKYAPCTEARLERQTSTRAVLDVRSGTGTCLLVLPTQFSDFLVASAGERTFPVIPVNQVMTGIVVEDYAGTIALSPKSALGGETFFRIAGVLLIVGGFLFARRRRSTPC